MDAVGHLALFTHGALGQRSIQGKPAKDYIGQMMAEVREYREDSRGRSKAVGVRKQRDNHYLDCELMIDLAAIATGCLKGLKVEGSDEGAEQTP